MYYGRKNLGKKRRCRPRMRTVLEEPVSWRNAASRPGLDELRNSMRISERLTEWEPHGETRVDPRDHLSDGCEDGNGRPLAARRPDDVLERAYCLLVHVFELRPDVPRHGRAYDVDVIRVRRDRRPECEIELEVLRSVRDYSYTAEHATHGLEIEDRGQFLAACLVHLLNTVRAIRNDEPPVQRGQLPDLVWILGES